MCLGSLSGGLPAYIKQYFRLKQEIFLRLLIKNIFLSLKKVKRAKPVWIQGEPSSKAKYNI